MLFSRVSVSTHQGLYRINVSRYIPDFCHEEPDAMPSTQLRDGQCERIKDLLPGKITDCGVTAKGTDNTPDEVYFDNLPALQKTA